MLQVGDTAPDFALPYTPEQSIRLQQLRGSTVILAFYPSAWEPVTVEQFTTYRDLYPEWQQRSIYLLAISIDRLWCQMAFAHHYHLSFPLLSDALPYAATAQAYGVYLTQQHTSTRALFVVNAKGVVTWQFEGLLSVNPGIDGLLTHLEAL